MMAGSLRRVLVVGIVLLMGALACQIGELGLPGPARETAAAWEGTKVALATRAGGTAQVIGTSVVVQATATAQAWENYLGERQAWPLVLQDRFDDNWNAWPTGEDNGDYVNITFEVEEGKYRWQAEAVEDFIYWTRPSIAMVGDFWLSVDVQQISGPADGSVGVIFRMQDPQNYYALLIDNERNFGLLRSTPEGWIRIIDWSVSPAIQPFEANTLTIVGEGGHFYILINGQLAGEGNDETLQAGRSGVSAGLFNPGDIGTFEFDNFELRAPVGSVVEEEE